MCEEVSPVENLVMGWEERGKVVRSWCVSSRRAETVVGDMALGITRYPFS